MPSGYDSEEERIKIRKARDRTNGDDNGIKGGKENGETEREGDAARRPSVLIAGYAQMPGEASDAGEEARHVAKSFARLERRLDRWANFQPPGVAMIKMREKRARGTYYQQLPRARPPRAVATKEGLGGIRTSANRTPNGTARGVRRESFRIDVDGAPPEEGGGELDGEDRELLGELDADSEEDDNGDDEDDEA